MGSCMSFVIYKEILCVSFKIRNRANSEKSRAEDIKQLFIICNCVSYRVDVKYQQSNEGEGSWIFYLSCRKRNNPPSKQGGSQVTYHICGMLRLVILVRCRKCFYAHIIFVKYLKTLFSSSNFHNNINVTFYLPLISSLQ